LQRALEAVEMATGAMTAAELVQHTPGKWSAAEIVEHVSLACDSTSKLLQWYLDTGKLSAHKPTEKQQSVAKFVIEDGNFPSGLPAPGFAMPRGIDPSGVLSCLRNAIGRLDSTVARCEEAFGGQATLGKHTVLGPLTGQQWCQYHWVHTSHHVKQIEELKRWVRR
jgi:hypothetical protein